MKRITKKLLRILAARVIMAIYFVLTVAGFLFISWKAGLFFAYLGILFYLVLWLGSLDFKNNKKL